jgi:ABC-type polysaccharide/polyol phosphate transport system ATPase subunit
VSDDAILEVRHLSKLYARRERALRRRLGTIAGHAFFGGGLPKIDGLTKHEFWALKDISFELKRGQALGVIGLNGAGKTTLLRILAGQILPDQGEVRIAGTSASMIDLTAGFQPAETGLRNVYLRAATLGFTRRETKAMLDEIVEFSELGSAIEAPLSSYSSGMRLRLAFAVMAMVQPDVLFIDEVLAVGDFRFRQKCLARVREMRARSAFVFVSHSMGEVLRFCDRVIVLDKGQIIFAGDPKEAIEIYESLGADTTQTPNTGALRSAMGTMIDNEKAITDVEHYWCDETGQRIESVAFGKNIRLMVKFKSSITFRSLNIGVPVWNINAHYATGLSSEITSDEFQIDAGESVTLALDVQGGFLNPGTIKSVLSIRDGLEFLFRQPNPDLTIDKTSHPTWGSVTIPHTWRRIDEPQTSPQTERDAAIR